MKIDVNVRCFSQSQWWITLARSANFVGFIPSFLLFFMIPIVGWIPIYVLGLNPCYEPYSQCWYFVIVPRGKKSFQDLVSSMFPPIFSQCPTWLSLFGGCFFSRPMIPHPKNSQEGCPRIAGRHCVVRMITSRWDLQSIDWPVLGVLD